MATGYVDEATGQWVEFPHWDNEAYAGPGISPVYQNWLAQGNDPSSESMPLEVFLAWMGDRQINPDGTIQGTTGRVNPQTGMVDFKLQDDAGFLGSFLEFAEIPAKFYGAITGVNSLGNWLGNAGWQSAGIDSGFFQDAAGNLYNPSPSSLASPAGAPSFTEGLLTDPNTGRFFLPPTTPGGPPLLVPEGALIDPATGLPILPGVNGAPIFPGQPGYPSLPGFPSGGSGPMNFPNAPGAPGAPGAPPVPPAAPGGSSTTPAPKTDLQKIKDTLGISSAVGQLFSGLSTPSEGELAGLSRATDAGRRQVINQNLGKIEAAFQGFDDKYFDSIADAFKNYYQPQVDDTFKRASEQTIYAAPGGVGSTAFASKLGEVERDRSLAGVAVGEQSAEEAQRAKANIEGTKASLIGLAESSEDPGAFGAQAVAASKAAAQTPSYNPLADLFSRYANLAANASVANQQGYGRASPPTSFGGGRSSGSSSVKTVWS